MKKSVHTPTLSIKEARDLGLNVKLGPNSPLNEKPRKKRDNPEHRAQVRLFELLETEAKTDPMIAEFLPIIHAIPQFTDHAQTWRAKKHGRKYKAEGQRKGVPDTHTPVPMVTLQHGYMASLYVELKVDSYPSASQREMFPRLAKAGNAVLVIKDANPETCAQLACWTISAYLRGDTTFARYSHPKFTYLP